MLKSTAIILFFLLVLGLTNAQSRISQTNYNATQANSIVNNVSAYMSTINQNGTVMFSLFEPNLTVAYKNLALAQGNVTSNPNLAVRYANTAYNITQSQYRTVKYNEQTSFPVIFGFTALMLFLLYKFMLPVKKRKG